MVTVSDYAVRTNSKGDPFVALLLTGNLEMVQSQETGKFYATVKKCSVVSTFSEFVAAQMVGNQLPGTILKEECDEYEYTIPETGEVIELSHRWVYSPEEISQAPKTTEVPKVESPLVTFSGNGVAATA